MRIFKLLLILFFVYQDPKAALAETDYWINLGIKECRGLQDHQTSFAANSFGFTYCVYGGSSSSVADRLAIAQCNKLVPWPVRASAPCRIVMRNGKIIDEEFYSAMARDLFIPIKMISKNGIEKLVTEQDGFVVIKKSTFSSGRFINYSSLILKNGFEVCSGWVSPGEVGAKLEFNLKCVGNTVLHGNAIVSGSMIINGYRRLAVFRAKISNPPHELSFWTDQKK